MKEAPRKREPYKLISDEQARELAAMPKAERDEIVRVTAAILAKALHRKMNPSPSKDKPK